MRLRGSRTDPVGAVSGGNLIVHSLHLAPVRKGGLLVLAAALLLAVAAPALAQRGAIRGKIVDPDGNPVPDVQVSIVLLDGGGRPIRVKTNDKGEFLRAGIPVQMYRVSFEHDQRNPVSPAGGSAEPGAGRPLQRGERGRSDRLSGR